MSGRTFICGGDLRPGPRKTDCPNTLHDWPLPTGYVDASDVAMRRLRKRWANTRCPDCGMYGWVPPLDGADTDGMDRGTSRPPADTDTGRGQRPSAIPEDRWWP